jgi:hypothetical protein
MKENNLLQKKQSTPRSTDANENYAANFGEKI